MSLFNKLNSTVLAVALVLTSAAGASAVFMPPDRHVQIVNNTDASLVEFYATTRTTWEDDMLGNGVIGSQRSKRLNVDDRTGRCSFNFRAVFADGTEIVTRAVDVCTTGTYTYN